MSNVTRVVSDLYAANPSIADILKLKWTPYIPHEPFPKQRAFLCLPHREAFYGGAAGGGKSDSLLMAALQYVDIPGYAAIIFRKTLTDLNLPSSLLSRAHQWLTGTPAKYIASSHSYHFPTFYNDGTPGAPAIIQFGYIGEADIRTRYQSAEFQGCFFDELTQHMEEDYIYMFSRLRRLSCPNHLDKPADPNCKHCQSSAAVPIRMRSASNPGNFGHAWVKDRFQITGEPDPLRPGKLRFVGKHKDRPFIPAVIKDNPAIDQADYLQSLSNLPTVLREQMENGDWSVSNSSRYNASMFRRYTLYGMSYVLDNKRTDQTSLYFNLSQFRKLFFTIDPASSSKEGPGDTENWRTQKSYSVISIWGLTPCHNLLLLFNYRVRLEIPQLITQITNLYRTWKPHYMLMESNGLGRAVFQVLSQKGFPTKGVNPHTDKVVRSTQAVLLAEKGRIWIPHESLNYTWLKEWESEIFTWTGHVHQTDDQVDALSYAGIEASLEAVNLGHDPTGEALDEIVFNEAPSVF